MSHHFDSPTAIADGRLNACDLYAFPTAPGRSALLLTINPDAGRSSPTTLRDEALYEFVIATDGGTSEDLAFRIRAEEPREDGTQRVQVVRATGETSRSGIEGDHLGTGELGTPFDLTGGGTAWIGHAADPFFADGAALAQFLQAAHSGRYEPAIFTSAPHNLFASRNVTALLLDLPDDQLGDGGPLAVWGRISLYGHAPQQQVSRIGQPMLRPLFFPVPGPDTEALNAGRPGTDRGTHGDAVTRTAAAIARLAGIDNVDEHAAHVADAFLPDVLRYQPGARARFHPGKGALAQADDSEPPFGNGRAIYDDAFAIAIAMLTGSVITAPVEGPAVEDTPPFLPPADSSDLPALADLFGFREHAEDRS